MDCSGWLSKAETQCCGAPGRSLEEIRVGSNYILFDLEVVGIVSRSGDSAGLSE